MNKRNLSFHAFQLDLFFDYNLNTLTAVKRHTRTNERSTAKVAVFVCRCAVGLLTFWAVATHQPLALPLNMAYMHL